MTTETDVMPYDATLLARVLEERGVSIQALANRAGYDDKSVYRYLAGERTIPSTVLRAAFELTGDLRLIHLIAGAVPLAVGVLSAAAPAAAGRPEPLRVPPIDQLFTRAADALEQLTRSIRYVHKIAADGRIDQSDDAAIENFRGHAAEAQRLIALTTAALDSHRRTTGPGARR